MTENATSDAVTQISAKAFGLWMKVAITLLVAGIFSTLGMWREFAVMKALFEKESQAREQNTDKLDVHLHDPDLHERIDARNNRLKVQMQEFYKTTMKPDLDRMEKKMEDALREVRDSK